MSDSKSGDRIIRVKHERNYVQIMNSTARDTRLSWKARGLHHYILSLPDDWDICIAHLAGQSEKDGIASVRSGLKELEAAGYVAKTRLKDKRGRFSQCLWHVYETPQVDFQLVDETARRLDPSHLPQVDFPHAEKPHAENRTLRKPSKTNTDLKKTNLKQEKEILDAPLSFFLENEDEEVDAGSINSFRAKNPLDNSRPPNPQSPLSPATPENLPKPVKRDRQPNQTEQKKELIDPLLKDHEFLKFLFRELKRTKAYFQPFSDTDYESHTRIFLEISYESSAKGDRRFRDVEEFVKAYDRYKAERIRVEEERAQREREREQEAYVPLTPEQMQRRRAIALEIKRQNELKKMGMVV